MSDQHIVIRDDTLPKVSEFKYLGRILTADNNDWVTMSRNLSRAIERWGKIRRILVRDGATQPMMVSFYRAIILSVLLYGAETWEYSPAMVLKLEAFHNRAIRHLCGKHIHPISEDGETWVYPSSKELLKETKLKSIGEYIYERRHNFRLIAEGISPMLRKCQDWEKNEDHRTQDRKRGWWHSSVD